METSTSYFLSRKATTMAKLVQIRVGNFGQIVGSGTFESMQKYVDELKIKYPTVEYNLEPISGERHQELLDSCEEQN